MPGRTYKVVLLGDFGVGKTSLGVRITEDRFEETTKATIGVAHFSANVMDSYFRRTALEIWDTAGQERYRSLDNMRMYLRNALAALVLLDVTSRQTFQSAKRLVEQLRSEDVGAADELVIVLVANKCDLPYHEIDQAALDAYARQTPGVSSVHFVSCKTGHNISSLVRNLADTLAALPDDADPAAATGGIIMPGGHDTSSSSCC